MARRAIGSCGAEHVELPIEPRQQLGCTEQRHARRRQLDGQRQRVEPADDGAGRRVARGTRERLEERDGVILPERRDRDDHLVQRAEPFT